MHSQFKFCIILLFVIEVCSAQNGLQECKCVPNNKCYPNLVIDDDREVDIRIVNTNSPIIPPSSPPSSAPSAPSPCTNGLIQCCTECGITYNISSGPKPAVGQSLYGAQPWQAVIFDNKYNYLGGGVLIDEKHVLTAAHKVYEFENKPTSILVRLGEWDSGNNKTELYRSQDSAISKIIIHENYSDSPKNLFNDVAVLKLSTTIRYGPTVNPAINTACLPNATMNFTNMRCIVSGWGKNSFDGSYQRIIMEVDVPVLSDTLCEARLKTTKLGDQFKLDTKSFICAGGEPGKDACVGDGGSPLMCKVADKYQVVGLVAWGIGCANGDIPGVYVRVQSYLDFISKSISI